MQAFVIKKQITGEYDQIITLYTKEAGRLEVVAKSILKPKSIQAMHVERLNLINCELIEGRAMPILTGAQSVKNYITLKSNLSSLAIANYISESIDKMTFSYQADEAVWRFIESSFNKLDSDKIQSRKELTSYGLELLSVLGFYPNLEQCTFCSKEEECVAFSPELVGVVCRECFLSGRRAIMIQKGQDPIETSLQGIFESLAGSIFHSLTFAKAVLQ